MTSRDAQELLRRSVSERLFAHSANVARCVVEMARRWGAPVEEAELAGWLHDYCKERTAQELLDAAARLGVPVDPVDRLRPVQLLHAPVAAAELLLLGLPAVSAEAIRRHTVGGSGMNVLDQCLYVADAVAEGRVYPGVEELRAMTEGSLPRAVAWSARRTLVRLIERGRPIHPDTLALYNEMLDRD
jgi:predicted HD superfamily hydrolase involved in NAD metabolism